MSDSEIEVIHWQYDGRISAACADGCQDGEGCGARGPYTMWCGGCCACRGGCRWGYDEQEREIVEDRPTVGCADV